MRENGLRTLHGHQMKHIPAPKPPTLIPNLLQRQFAISRKNQAWVTDITYIRTWQGWLYLAVVIDLFSRKIVGWATRSTIYRELALEAVTKAVKLRHPRKAAIHSDQCTQYESDAWRRFCLTHHLEPSMSQRGNCWDNAVAESFFSSLRNERIKNGFTLIERRQHWMWPSTLMASIIRRDGTAILGASVQTNLNLPTADRSHVSTKFR